MQVIYNALHIRILWVIQSVISLLHSVWYCCNSGFPHVWHKGDTEIHFWQMVSTNCIVVLCTQDSMPGNSGIQLSLLNCKNLTAMAHCNLVQCTKVTFKFVACTCGWIYYIYIYTKQFQERSMNSRCSMYGHLLMYTINGITTLICVPIYTVKEVKVAGSPKENRGV